MAVRNAVLFIINLLPWNLFIPPTRPPAITQYFVYKPNFMAFLALFNFAAFVEIGNMLSFNGILIQTRKFNDRLAWFEMRIGAAKTRQANLHPNLYSFKRKILIAKNFSRERKIFHLTIFVFFRFEGKENNEKSRFSSGHFASFHFVANVLLPATKTRFHRRRTSFQKILWKSCWHRRWKPLESNEIHRKVNNLFLTLFGAFENSHVSNVCLWVWVSFYCFSQESIILDIPGEK